ncbi:hypothetical protein H845_1190 [Komagataeibacter xylinus E25]|nr:hypothetical protein H845_1190 [Komagataeibacter xylinus E25]
MYPAGFSCSHHLSDRGIPVFCQTIYAASDQKVCSKFVSQAIEFVNVTFPIANMDASFRGPSQIAGAAQVVEPAHAFFLLYGHAGRVNPAFQGCGSFELAPRPEFGGSQTKRKPFRSDGQTGVHQQTTKRVQSETPCFFPASRRDLGKPDLFGRCSGEGKLRCILQDQDWPCSRIETLGGSRKMPFKDFVFAYICICKKSICCLGRRPILKCRRERLARSFSKCREHRAQTPVQALVAKVRSGYFLYDPILYHSHTPPA